MRLIDANLIEEIFKEQGYDYCAGVVYCTPTINAEPIRYGRWIGKPIGGYSTVRCSMCYSVFAENNGKWNYCPHCGARMDGEEE